VERGGVGCWVSEGGDEDGDELLGGGAEERHGRW
jgi:hypothetical protein